MVKLKVAVSSCVTDIRSATKYDVRGFAFENDDVYNAPVDARVSSVLLDVGRRSTDYVVFALILISVEFWSRTRSKEGKLGKI